MAGQGGRGPAPKAKRSRERDNHRPQARLERPDEVAAPALPKSYRTEDGTLQFLKETREWWATWVRSPQAKVFLETDWRTLLQIAPLVDEHHRAPSVKLMAEIRLTQERLGATAADRLRLRWEVSDPQKPAKGSRPSAQQRKDELAARREKAS